MIEDVAQPMQTFFVPQMEQLGLRELEARHGSLSTIDAEVGEGILWAFSLAEDCLYTYNKVQVQSDINFIEFPENSICLSYMSRDSVLQIPCDLIAKRRWSDKNLVSFRMDGTPMECRIAQGEQCCAHSLVMLPSFFDRMEGLTDVERQQLFDFLSAADRTDLPSEIAPLFAQLVPALSLRASGNLYCAAKVNEILAAVVDAAFSKAEGEEPSLAEDALIAQEAKHIIDRRFAEKLTTTQIAHELFVGRTYLCEAFHREFAMGLGEYIRERRMEEAALLLANTRGTISQIAHAVGYAHASSFVDAFGRHFGVSPARYRKGEGRWEEK